MGKHCILLPSNCSLMICQLLWWQQWQPLDVLCCANIRFHEVGLLAETVNQCRPKTPQGETLLLSGQVNSVTWWQCSPAVPASCARTWAGDTQKGAWDRDAHGELLALPVWLHKTGSVKAVWVLVKVRYQPAACQMQSTNISDQDLPQFLGGEFVFKLLS